MRDWLVLLVALCGVVEAAEPSGAAPLSASTIIEVPRWEYALLMPVYIGADVYLAFETTTRQSIPREFDGNPQTRNLAPVELLQGSEGDLEFPNTAAALTWAGREGWEIVQHLGRGQYLARRPLPPKL